MCNKVRTIFGLMLGAFSLMAQAQINPTPQQMQKGKNIVLPRKIEWSISKDNRETMQAIEKDLNVLNQRLPVEGKTCKLLVGRRGDKHIRKYEKLIPKKAEGYYLEVTSKSIVIAANDDRGLFYAQQTLRQLIHGDSIEQATITDWPDVPYRGVVEGFYGTPWSHEARLRQLDFYGRNKLNTYIYGPKDDPYHSTPHWRDPYPEKEAAQLRELVLRAQRNYVDFVWAIHPGRDIQWNEADRDRLMAKFESMYQLGVRSFAVFFDDISGDGTDPKRQAELLNYLDDNFVKVKGDVTPLIMCPTEYNKAWSNVEGGYLSTLGSTLNPTVQVMWTGDRVIACIDKPTMEWINPLIRRKAYIWWNFPVSDYVRDHLLLGPVYGNGLDIKDDIAAFVSNPMEHAEASKIALFSVADYAWNMAAYNTDASWNRAIADLMPKNAANLKIFAEHSSDLGPNGHGFRRDESVALQPALKQLVEWYKKDNLTDKEITSVLYPKILDEHDVRNADERAADSVRLTLWQIKMAAEILQKTSEAPEFIDEARPWLQQFDLLGRYGQTVLNMMMANESSAVTKTDFEQAYNNARSLQKQMFELDATANQNPYQPGVKVGSKVLLPTLNELFALCTERYNKANQVQLDTRATYSPYTWASDVPQLAQQPLQSRAKLVRVSPSNEVIKWPVGASISIALDAPKTLSEVSLDLGTSGIANIFTLETSADGKAWTALPLTQKEGETAIHAQVPENMSCTVIRLRSNSKKEAQVYLKKFEAKF